MRTNLVSLFRVNWYYLDAQKVFVCGEMNIGAKILVRRITYVISIVHVYFYLYTNRYAVFFKYFLPHKVTRVGYYRFFLSLIRLQTYK